MIIEVIIILLILLLMFSLEFFLLISLNLIIKIINYRKNKIALVTIIKNEEAYLEEWLKFHLNQGFDHIYIYLNDKNKNNYKYLSKYKDKITIVSWINKKNNLDYTIQKQAYTNCIRRCFLNYQWLALLDVDEFMFPIDKKFGNVKQIFEKLDKNKIRSVRIPRYNYGNNGYLKKPVGGVIKNYTKREKICSSFKTVANLDFVNLFYRFNRVHDFPYYSKKGKDINKDLKYENKEPKGCSKDFVNKIPLVINHYKTIKLFFSYLFVISVDSPRTKVQGFGFNRSPEN